MNARTLVVLSIVVATAAGCSGLIGGDDENKNRPPADPGAPPPPAEEPVGEGGLRLLTQHEYQNTIADLFGAEVKIPKLSHDAVIEGFTTVGATTASLTAAPTQDLEAAALAIAEGVMTASNREKVAGCIPSGAPADACVRGFVERWGGRLFRRLLDQGEIDRYVDVATAATKELASPWDGLSMALAALLESPNFLYRVEGIEADPSAPSAPASSGKNRYSSTTMASRLSYLVWGSTPDDELLASGARGELVTNEGIAKSLDRLLADPKAERGLLAFFREWLELDGIASVAKDNAVFPELTPAIRAAMREQIERTIKGLVWDGDASFLDLFTTRRIFMNAELAPLYGVDASQVTNSSSGWVEISLDDPSRRPGVGLLGWAGILTRQARQTKTSPTLRGLFVRERVLCQKLGSPPPNVDQLQKLQDPDGKPLTVRGQSESRMADSRCVGCHKPMDGIGLGLESFDGIGRFHVQDDSGTAIDTSGEIDGTTFKTPIELVTALRAHPQTAACASRNIFRFAMGRLETQDDAESLSNLSASFAASSYRLKKQIVQLAMNDVFRRPVPVQQGGK